MLYKASISGSHSINPGSAVLMAGLNSLPIATGMFHVCEVTFSSEETNMAKRQ
jgi:hypothetical protein